MRLLLLTVLSTALVWGAEVRDAKSIAIAESMMKAMGGQDAWNRVKILRFDFRVNAGGKVAVDRSHLWDKQTGRYRLETMKDGKPVVAFLNLAAPGSDKASKDAYATFINDVYWLAMPWKWLEKGVHLKYLGRKSRGSKQYDVVELSFDKVGLTPGDRYQAYVSPESNLMEHWEYTLQSGNKGSWSWEYTTTGGVKLAQNHVSADGKSIHMGTVRVMDSVDDTLFTDPGKRL